MDCHKLLGNTWRCLQGKCSTLLTDMFSPLNAGRATRSQGNRALKFPVTKTSAGTHSAAFQCVSLWNRLQPDIRKNPQYHQFMRSLPAHMHARALPKVLDARRYQMPWPSQRSKYQQGLCYPYAGISAARWASIKGRWSRLYETQIVRDSGTAKHVCISDHRRCVHILWTGREEER